MQVETNFEGSSQKAHDARQGKTFYFASTISIVIQSFQSTYNLSIKTFKKYDVKKLKESFDPEKDRKKFVCPICDQRYAFLQLIELEVILYSFQIQARRSSRSACRVAQCV